MSARHPIEAEELMAYLDGELAAKRASAVVSHLEKCANCQNLSADLHALSQGLLAWETEVPNSEIPSRIAAALEEKARKSERKQIAAPPPRNATNHGWRWVGAFAILCLVVGLGARLDSHNLPRTRTVSRAQGAAKPATTGQKKRVNDFVTLNEPSIAADSSGLFHGLGDHAENSFSVNGQPLSQKRKVSEGPDLLGGARFSAPAAPVGPMVVHTAGITITVKDFDKARADLDAVLRRHHGYIAELNLNTPNEASRNFTSSLRLPASELDATIAELRNFGRVESESQSGDEVTAQYIDLQARLSNARNTEQRLTDLLRQRTGRLSDVLSVETELDRVRGEIERMEAERKNLANKVDFATINATVTEDYRAQLEVVPTSTLGQIRNAAVEGYRTMSEGVLAVVLFFFSYGPSILLWGAILFFPARFAWKKRHQIFHR